MNFESVGEKENFPKSILERNHTGSEKITTTHTSGGDQSTGSATYTIPADGEYSFEMTNNGTSNHYSLTVQPPQNIPLYSLRSFGATGAKDWASISSPWFYLKKGTVINLSGYMSNAGFYTVYYSYD